MIMNSTKVAVVGSGSKASKPIWHSLNLYFVLFYQKTYLISTFFFKFNTVSGAVCASNLARNGVSVTLFESARGPGGRMSQRRSFFLFDIHFHF